MNKITKSGIFLAALLPFFSLVAQTNPSIEDLMSAEELPATRVGALNSNQKRALNARIKKNAAGTIIEASTPVAAAATSQPEAAQTQEQAQPSDSWRARPDKVEFNSRFTGDFSGWTGRTRFALENGQVWEQRRGRRWKSSLSNPEVRIYQNFMCAYEMEVLEAERSIGVKRIR